MKPLPMFAIAALCGLLIMSPTPPDGLPINKPFTLAQLREEAHRATTHGHYDEAAELLTAAAESPAATVFVHFQGREDEVRGFATLDEARAAITANN